MVAHPARARDGFDAMALVALQPKLERPWYTLLLAAFECICGLM
jgi:hypothetical protein